MIAIVTITVGIVAFLLGYAAGQINEAGRWRQAARSGNDVWSGNTRYRVYEQPE